MRSEGRYKNIPSTVSATLKRLSQIVLLIVASIILNSYWYDKYYLTPEFGALAPIPKVLTMVALLLLMMSTYLIGFCFMECGPIASGLSFNGYDAEGNARHDLVKSVDLMGLVTSTQVKEFLSSWNISVHEWLKNYVYLRQLSSKNQSRAKAALVSFMVSAIWHGFYPGFFHFFFWAFVLDYWNKLASKVIAQSGFPQLIPTHVTNIFCTLFYYVYCSYFALSFILLYFSDFNRVYREMYYTGHVFLIVTIPVLMLIAP